MHCHVDLMQSMSEFSKLALEKRINLLAMTTTPKAYEIEMEKLSGFPNIKVALGLHPQLAFERNHELSLVEKYIGKAKFIGEIGLDFNKPFYYSKEHQIDVFTQIIKWCKRSPLKVLSIHSVRSNKNLLDIMERYESTKLNYCILHWYSGSLKQLERAIELGCYFSVNEYMLKSPNGQLIAKEIPVNRLLLESDAPFISEIKTVEQLERKLKYSLNELVRIKGGEVVECIYKTSQRLFDI